MELSYMQDNIEPKIDDKVNEKIRETDEMLKKWFEERVLEILATWTPNFIEKSYNLTEFKEITQANQTNIDAKIEEIKA